MATLVTNKKEISELIGQLGKNIVCDPFKTNDESIITHLLTFDGPIAHTTSDNHIIFKNESGIYKFEKPESINFLNTIDATDAAQRLQENLDGIKSLTNIETILGFKKESIDTINIVILNEPTFVSKESVFFMITFKNGQQYLDFVAWNKSGTPNTFSQQTANGLIHSGDKAVGSYFTQSIKVRPGPIQRDSNQDFVLGGIGYSRTPLTSETYKHQKPSMCCYDPNTHTINVIPFQQIASILLENTTIACASVYFVDTMLKVVPYIDVPTTDTTNPSKTKYNTTDSITCGLPERCLINASRIEIAEPTDTNDTENQLNQEDSIEPLNSYDVINVNESNIVQVTTDTSLLFSNENALNIDYLGNKDGNSSMFNPALFGISKPSSYNGHIEPSNTHIDGFLNIVDKSKLVVLHFKDSDDFPEECGTMIDTPISCLAIINVTFGEHSVQNVLENLKLSCTKYANHCSIVLAKCSESGTYYWIRGIRWFHKTVYQFGDVFPQTHVDTLLVNQCPFPTHIGTQMYSIGKKMESSHIQKYITDMDFDTISTQQEHIIELFIQQSVLVSPTHFKTFKTACLTMLKEKQEENSKLLKQDIKIKTKSIMEHFTQHGMEPTELKKKLASLKHETKQNRACVKLKKLAETIIGITSEGGASSKAVAKSLENTIRADLVSNNVDLVNSLSHDDIQSYIEDIEQFIICEIEPSVISELLKQVSNNTFTKSSNVASLHNTCSELDGTTVAALTQHINDMGIDHYLKEAPGVIVCGVSERNSCIPIAVIPQFSELDDPRHFKWIERVNDIEIAKYRLILRRIIPESANGRSLNIKGSSKSLTYFLISMFISVAQNIKSKFTTIPTDKDSFTVIAMRNLLGYIFTSLASGTTPLSNIWQVLSHYPTHVPNIDSFDSTDLWILLNLIDMFPYCMWTKAESNFKKNTLTGVTKLLGKYIITPELKKIDEAEKKELEAKTCEISKELTTVWQWQKLVIISILKILNNTDEYEPSIVKHVSQCLIDSYPDIDEKEISGRHKKSNSSNKLKIMLMYMAKHGGLKPSSKQIDTLRFIIAKRMHSYYHHLCKEGRTSYFSKLTNAELYKELEKLIGSECPSSVGGPANKFLNSWAFSYNSNTKDIIISKEETIIQINKLFSSETPNTHIIFEDSISTPEQSSTELVVKYPDIREQVWLSVNDDSKMTTFVTTQNIGELVQILEYVFPEKNVHTIMTDICGVLLDNYKDRAKAYEIVLTKYKFD